MLFIDCYDLYLILTHKVVYKIYVSNLVYFVFIFDLSDTFLGIFLKI